MVKKELCNNEQIAVSKQSPRGVLRKSSFKKYHNIRIVSEACNYIKKRLLGRYTSINCSKLYETFLYRIPLSGCFADTLLLSDSNKNWKLDQVLISSVSLNHFNCVSLTISIVSRYTISRQCSVFLQCFAIVSRVLAKAYLEPCQSFNGAFYENR